MTYSKAIDNNFIFSISASRVILVITWGMMACNLSPTSLSHRFCHKDETKGWILIKTSVHSSSKCAGCAFDKVSFAARSASSFPEISMARNPTKCNEFTVKWYFLTGLQDPVYKRILTLLAFNGLEYRYTIRKYYKAFHRRDFKW